MVRWMKAADRYLRERTGEVRPSVWDLPLGMIFSNMRLASFLAISFLASLATALGTSCSAPLGAGTAGPNDPFWQQTIARNGLAPYSSSPSSYSVFRNVKVCCLHDIR
jgi:hypothetical protein